MTAVGLRFAVVLIFTARAVPEFFQVVVFHVVRLRADVPTAAAVTMVRFDLGDLPAGFAQREKLLVPVERVEDLLQGPPSRDPTGVRTRADFADVRVTMMTMRFRMHHTENMVFGHNLFV